VSNWFKYNGRRKIIREDRRYLEARARRFLKSYLLTEWSEKNQYYEVVAGAADACRPEMSDPNMDDAQIAEATSDAALRVVRRREQTASEDGQNHVATLITDAYATVAVAYRRAAGVYTIDVPMLQLGTAAVHLLTIANSYMIARPKAEQKSGITE
jgi:hypothetical protein